MTANASTQTIIYHLFHRHPVHSMRTRASFHPPPPLPPSKPTFPRPWWSRSSCASTALTSKNASSTFDGSRVSVSPAEDGGPAQGKRVEEGERGYGRVVSRRPGKEWRKGKQKEKKRGKRSAPSFSSSFTNQGRSKIHSRYVRTTLCSGWEGCILREGEKG